MYFINFFFLFQFHLVNMSILSLCILIFIDYYFPQFYNLLILNGSLYIIFIYSKCEIYIKKIYNNKQIQLFIKNIKKHTNNDDKFEIEVIRSNKIILNTNKNYINMYKLPDLLVDFIIFNDYTNTCDLLPKINKIIFYKNYKNPLNYNYIICKFSFISLLMVVDDDINYQIKLSNDMENYYIVGNKINLLILSYLLKIQHNIIKKIQSYTLTIIDHNINMITITEKDEILFNENDYIITPYTI